MCATFQKGLSYFIPLFYATQPEAKSSLKYQSFDFKFSYMRNFSLFAFSIRKLHESSLQECFSLEVRFNVEQRIIFSLSVLNEACNRNRGREKKVEE